MRLLAVRDPGAVRVVSDAAELVGRHLAAVVQPARAAAGHRDRPDGRRPASSSSDPIGTAVRRRRRPQRAPEIVLGALGTRNTALGAIALALDETDWLPAAARPA